MKFLSRRRAGVSSIVGSIFFVLIMIVAIASLVTIFNSFTAYNQQVTKAGSAKVQAVDTQLAITGSSFGPFPPSTPSTTNNVATSCTVTSTFPTNRPKVFTAAGMWWDFYTCNSNYQYSTSFDGVTWETPTSVPAIVAGYTVGSDFDVEAEGTTLYYAIAKVGASDFQLGIGTLVAGGTYTAPAGTISWTSTPAQVVTTANAIGPIQLAIDGAGNVWAEVHQVAGANTAIAIYERQACASGIASNNGWEPNTCGSGANPTNYAPAALGTLTANAHTIFSEAPATLSATGAVMTYETGSAVNPSTGTLAVITQTALASAAWNTITLSGITDYSLTSSSGIFVGNTLYIAGLANAAVGQTTGALKFWTLTFTSMTVAANTAEQTIESTTAAWQAALTASGNTLVLFDNPTATTIQYYSSSTLGSIWSAAISFVSGETAINGLCPSDNSFAITWTGASPFNVRFAALSAITVTNSSPFSVHVVDLYVYNSGTNTLVAHYYLNSTEDFDYWVGQGGTTAIPVRFVWAAGTSYLFTLGTDAGVTTQLTSTSPPVSSTTCSAGQFLTQITPALTCSSENAAASPAVAFTSNANTCTDITITPTAKMMGLGVTYTTSASSSGSLYVVLTFNLASPAVSNVNSKWQLAYGTGAAPACNAAAAGTLTAQQYTVNTEAAVVLGAGQSVGVTITGLSANTAYWFDVQSVDSSTDAWVYSLPSLSVTDVLTSVNQVTQLGYSSNTNTCTISSATANLMGGLGTTYTTGSSAAFDGNLYLTLSFGVTSPATTTINSQWRVAYGTGAAPTCGTGVAGTAVGNLYQVSTEAGVVLGMPQSESVVIPNLLASTTYWFDVQVTDSTAASWIYSNPTLAVAQMPALQYLPPNVNFLSDANSCGRNTAANGMAGFGTTYTTLSSSTGSIFAALTFKVASPATANLNTKWQVAYGTGVPPACNAAVPPAGLVAVVGRQYTINTEAAVVGGMGQTIGFVLTGLTRGTQYWFDIEATDSSVAVWTYSNPALSVMDIMPADVVHGNTEFSINTNSCGRNTAATAMAGFSFVTGAVSNDMVYTTTSFGSGNVKVDLSFNVLSVATAAATSTWRLVYGTGTGPACNVAVPGGATLYGSSFTLEVSATGAGGQLGTAQSEAVTIVGLTPGTTYWFDVQAADSTAGVWTYSNPSISVVELP